MTDESPALPESVPVFPLPDAVLFPRQVIPLHIFEPRYREMTAEALAGEKCIAIALLRPGFEPTYFTRHAPIHDIVGVGRIVAHEVLADGKYNILLRGDNRARLVEETCGRPYRVARIEDYPSYCSAPRVEVASLRKRLREIVGGVLWGPAGLREGFVKLCDAHMPMSDVVDVIAAGLPIDAELRQDMLAEQNAFCRALQLIEHIRTLGAVHSATRGQARQYATNLN